MGQNAEETGDKKGESLFPQTQRICTVYDYGTPEDTHTKSCISVYAKLNNPYRLCV
jgi:hypothetical protein